jgi:hypothetical protein
MTGVILPVGDCAVRVVIPLFPSGPFLFGAAVARRGPESNTAAMATPPLMVLSLGCRLR